MLFEHSGNCCFLALSSLKVFGCLTGAQICLQAMPHLRKGGVGPGRKQSPIRVYIGSCDDKSPGICAIEAANDESIKTHELHTSQEDLQALEYCSICMDKCR